METNDTVRISNNGNSRGQFKWLTSTNDLKLYSIKPIEGFVESNSFLDCKVSYTPNSTSGSGKIDEDRMFLRVINFNSRYKMVEN